MFRLREIFQAVVGFPSPKKKTILNHNVIKAKNDCGEDRFIAVEKQYQNEDINILVTKVRRLLSFVESDPVLERRYAPMLIDFGQEIENCVRYNYNLESLFLKYDTIKKRVRGVNSTSTNNIVCK
jgi:hypothetical protein|tara:strand:+ start:468 stop:842 length:375 start_codon:yes stop_codon:yes gene_type:complete